MFSRLRSRPVLHVVLAVVLVAALAILGRLVLIVGWFQESRLGSGSMAETLLGPHQEVECADCRFLFRCGADSPPPEGLAVCPNCGYRGNQLTGLIQPGNRVYIDRLPYLFASPQRWDIIAFRGAESAKTWTVKRIVGLPGERISIRDGDLWIDSRRLTKDWPLLNQFALLVWDSAARPQASSLPPRWGSDAPDSRWSQEVVGFRCAAATGHEGIARRHDDTPEGERFDWITYRHWPCVLSSLPRSEEGPVQDRDSYHQGTPREYHVVPDLILAVDLAIAPEMASSQAAAGRYALRMDTYGSTWIIDVDATRRTVELWRDAARVDSSPWPSGISPVNHCAVLAAVDRQIWFVVGKHEGDQIVVSHPVGETSPSAGVKTTASGPATTRPVAIGAGSSGLRVDRIRLFRDVHYLGVGGTAWPWSSGVLPAGRYVVLGDNPTVSDDSRDWREPGLARERIMGRVTPPPKSVCGRSQ